MSRPVSFPSPEYSFDGEPVNAVPAQFALYPFGGFTSFTVSAGSVHGWSLHAARLIASTEELWGHNLDVEQVRDQVREHISRTREETHSVRVTVFPTDFNLGSPEEAFGCRILISSSPCDPAVTQVTSYTAQTVQHARTFPHLKTLGISSQISLRRQARLAGFDDALLMAGDTVLEGATWSVIVWSSGRVVTPGEGVLGSVTVALLSDVAKSLGHAVTVGPVTLADLATADLVLAVNVSNPARALSQVDNIPIPVNEALLTSIADGYEQLPAERL